MTAWKSATLRCLVAASLPLFVVACSTPMTRAEREAQARSMVNADLANIYGEVNDGGRTVPAIDVSEINRRNLRQIVSLDTKEAPGTVIVDPRDRFLYLVMPGGKAMRYGIGVAKAGLAFQGRAYIGRKATWPGWTPTSAMIKREPKRYGPFARGLKGGVENPLGARALYLYRNGSDTSYRIHGTNEPWSIGERVSSGCIRLFNQDIIDLFNRVPSGTKVVVLGSSEVEADDDYAADTNARGANDPDESGAM